MAIYITVLIIFPLNLQTITITLDDVTIAVRVEEKDRRMGGKR